MSPRRSGQPAWGPQSLHLLVRPPAARLDPNSGVGKSSPSASAATTSRFSRVGSSSSWPVSSAAAMLFILARRLRLSRPAAGAAVLILALSPLAVQYSVSASAGSLRNLTPHEAGEAFLSGYVESDGRVTRRDQGGDTVSEGQAYATLVAAALNDQQHFTTVWAWTKRNLARKDDLLAWRWKDGKVIDRCVRLGRRPRRRTRSRHRGSRLR
jgi:hypothetical protein